MKWKPFKSLGYSVLSVPEDLPESDLAPGDYLALMGKFECVVVARLRRISEADDKAISATATP